MKQPSVYLKMRVLGAIDTVQGKTRHERIRNVAALTFLDEEGHSRQFTWRTIQTWFYRYKNHGVTGMTHQPRKDKGHARKVTPEELLEALNTAKPHFHNRRTNKRALTKVEQHGKLIFPDSTSAPNVANIILAELDSGSTPKTVADDAKKAAQGAWLDFAGPVFDEYQAIIRGRSTGPPRRFRLGRLGCLVTNRSNCPCPMSSTGCTR